MLARRLALFFALFCAIIASQLPEYAQQYRQRLGGALDELTAIIARFDEDCAQAGFSEQDGIKRLIADGDEFIRERGTQMQQIVLRRQKLSEALAMIEEPFSFDRVWILALDFDAGIARQAYANYRPAVPLTSEGFIAAGIGFLSSFIFFRFIAPLFKHRPRLGVPRGAPAAKQF